MNALIKKISGIPAVIAENTEWAVKATQIVSVCRRIEGMPVDHGEDGPLQCTPENLSLAMKLDDAMPSYEVINLTCIWLSDALIRVLDPRLARSMVAVLLGSLGKRPGDDPELYIWGLTEAIGDEDEVLTDDATRPVTPCTLAYAVRKMIREQIFPPAPAELRAACERMSLRLEGLYREIVRYCTVREAVDGILISFGPGPNHGPSSEFEAYGGNGTWPSTRSNISLMAGTSPCSARSTKFYSDALRRTRWNGFRPHKISPSSSRGQLR
jgi:hypothetical protein